jgi:hypothetical protein
VFEKRGHGYIASPPRCCPGFGSGCERFQKNPARIRRLTENIGSRSFQTHYAEMESAFARPKDIQFMAHAKEPAGSAD